MSNLQSALRSSAKKVHRLQAKVEELIERNSIQLKSKDADDIAQVMTKVDPIVKSTFSENSAQQIFWEQQLK